MNDKKQAEQKTHAIAFTQGKGGTSDDVERYVAEVLKMRIGEVVPGVVEKLKAQGCEVSVKNTSEESVITVIGKSENTPRKAEAVDDADFLPGNITTNITIVANAADVPEIVNALNGFFGNWNAVAGLIAIGAVVIGGIWLLRVEPRPAGNGNRNGDGDGQ